MEDWYLEYSISRDRPGLLGDIASLMGMLSINIVTISGVEERRRGFLLRTEAHQKIAALRNLLGLVENITVTALRQPTVLDRLALRHGKLIQPETEGANIYKFTRDELGILVDFLGESLKKEGHQVIGIRGMPRVGKTESIVAASVYASRRWTFVSSTLLKQTVRSTLAEDELNCENMVYILDGVVSIKRSSEQHVRLIREIMALDAPKVIEHPDIFIMNSEYGLDVFDKIIELRNTDDEEITYDQIKNDIFGMNLG